MIKTAKMIALSIHRQQTFSLYNIYGNFYQAILVYEIYIYSNNVGRIGSNCDQPI